MAQTIRLLSETPINGTSYPKGKVLSVSESIRDSLVGSGVAEDYKAQVVKPTVTQPEE